MRFYHAEKLVFAEARALETDRFIDYYEVLEISPNANSETIDRIFRYLAQRYHPDNADTGDRHRFDEIVRARNTLADPVKRARYDLDHKDHWGAQRKLAGEAADWSGIEKDVDIQDRLLSLLYIKRRRNINDPGIGDIDLEHLSGCPRDHLEFHLWYLKEKGWIGKTDNGMFAITVEGVDRAQLESQPKPTIRLLRDGSSTS